MENEGECQQWRMKVNVNKTKIMHIHRKNSDCTEQEFRLGSEWIEIVKCYKYLGVIIDEHVTMGMCEDSLAKAASRALHCTFNLKQFILWEFIFVKSLI